jgi:hypothetical protein
VNFLDSILGIFFTHNPPPQCDSGPSEQVIEEQKKQWREARHRTKNLQAKIIGLSHAGSKSSKDLEQASSEAMKTVTKAIELLEKSKHDGKQ